MNASYVKFFFIIPCGCPSTLLRMPRLVPSRKLPPLNKKMPDAEGFSIGLWNVGIIHHDFLSTPMLLNSSELIFETSKSALASAANTSKQMTTATTNIGFSPFIVYNLLNIFRSQKLYPLTVLITFRSDTVRITYMTKDFMFCSISLYDCNEETLQSSEKNHVSLIMIVNGSYMRTDHTDNPYSFLFFGKNSPSRVLVWRCFLNALG